MNVRVRFIVLVVIGLLISALVPALTVQAQGVFTHGAVVALQATPHLWIADAQGVLHWAGDTRALAGKHVRWDSRIEVTLAQLQGLNRGDPWLSAGLLKDGDPIYLVKWETEWSEPRLFHIQSIGDVELFGINGSNYGNFVLDRATWEQRFGISTAGLRRSKLPAATVPPAPPAPTFIGLAGTGPGTRRVDLTEGLWTINVTVNRNRECSSNTCAPSELVVFVVTWADGKPYGDYMVNETVADWSGTATVRVDHRFPSVDPGKRAVNVGVLAADAAWWQITLRKQ